MNNRSNSKGHGKRTTTRDETTETETKKKAKTTIEMTTPQLLNRNTRNMPAWVVRERDQN